MLSNRFQFLIDAGAGPVKASPANDDFALVWNRDPKWGFFRQDLEIDFNFCGEEAKALIELDESCDRCDRIPVELQMKCNGQWENCFDAYLNLNDGNFDKDRCEALIKPRSEDDYACLFENWQREKNICSIEDRVEVKSIIGEIECLVCIEGTPITNAQNIVPAITAGFQDGPWLAANNCLPDNIAWTLTQNNVEQFSNLAGSVVYQNFSIARWCRETYTGPVAPPGDDWIQLSNDTWVRPINVECGDYASTGPQLTLAAGGPAPAGFINYFGKACRILEQDINLDDGITLEDALLFLLDDCPYELCSDFFNINPIGDVPINKPYFCAEEDLQNLVIYAKSDVINYAAEEAATKCDKDLKSILCNLFEIFNVRFEIIGNKMRLEHVSYFDSIQKQGLDLTINYSNCLPNKYSYENQKFPQFENFSWMDEVSDYFQGEPIEYKGECTELDDSIKHDADCFTTDINHILANSVYDPETGQTTNDEISYDGFVLVNAAEFNGELFVDTNNNHLSFTELHKCYYKHDRYQYEVCICGEDICANSAKRNKVQAPIQIHSFCCEDLKEFNPKDLIKTNMGWGEVVEAKYYAKTQCLDLVIAHDQIRCC